MIFKILKNKIFLTLIGLYLIGAAIIYVAVPYAIEKQVLDSILKNNESFLELLLEKNINSLDTNQINLKIAFPKSNKEKEIYIILKNNKIKYYTDYHIKDNKTNFIIATLDKNKLVIFKSSFIFDTSIIKYEILIIDAVMLLFAFFILSIMLYNIEKNLKETHDNLNYAFSDTINKLHSENKELEESMNFIKENFSKYVIYSATNLFGIITDASEAFSKISGYSREGLIGQNHNVLRHPDMNHAVFENMWDALENNKSWSGIIKNKKKDGSAYTVKTFITPIYDSEGVKIGYFSIRHLIHSKDVAVTDN